MRTTVTFDGVDLTDLFIVSDLRRALVPRDVSLVDVPGRDGSLFSSVSNTARTITMTMTVRSQDVLARSQAIRQLAAILSTAEPRPLAISDDSGLYYMAVPSSDTDGERFINAERFVVTFTCPDPWLYGDTVTETLPSGGSLALTVGGTAPTWPTITANATGGSQGSWIVTMEDGSGIYAAIPSGTTYDVTANCDERSMSVNDSVAMLPPSYDWPRLAPGAHTLTMTQGTGDATITWQERWW